MQDNLPAESWEDPLVEKNLRRRATLPIILQINMEKIEH
jgi:hypothetical protein